MHLLRITIGRLSWSELFVDLVFGCHCASPALCLLVCIRSVITLRLRSLIASMGDSARDGRMTQGDYCIMTMILFQTWTPLMMYTSRFHSEDVLTNIMCAARPSPPPTRRRAHCHLTPSLFRCLTVAKVHWQHVLRAHNVPAHC